MTYDEFLIQVIDGGIEGAKVDYSRPEQVNNLLGSIAGFEACRGRTPPQLAELLAEHRKKTQAAYWERDTENYWFISCQEIEIEWVCNVVSAMLVNEGREAIVPPTCRGALRAADIVGVKGR